MPLNPSWPARGLLVTAAQVQTFASEKVAWLVFESDLWVGGSYFSEYNRLCSKRLDIAGSLSKLVFNKTTIHDRQQPRLPFPFAIWSIDWVLWNPFLIKVMWPSVDSSSLLIEFLAFRKVAICCSEFIPLNWNFQRKARVLPLVHPWICLYFPKFLTSYPPGS